MYNCFTFLVSPESYKAPLSKIVIKEYNNFIVILGKVPKIYWETKCIDGTGGQVNARDIVAYQIGWGNLLINWYKAGLEGEMPQMPGEGFTTWNYNGLALHFYNKYQCKSLDEQLALLFDVVKQIVTIVENEHKNGNLDKVGVWAWCTLASGKQWPLSKWVTVNTASPYRRATGLLKKLLP